MKERFSLATKKNEMNLSQSRRRYSLFFSVGIQASTDRKNTRREIGKIFLCFSCLSRPLHVFCFLSFCIAVFFFFINPFVYLPGVPIHGREIEDEDSHPVLVWYFFFISIIIYTLFICFVYLLLLPLVTWLSSSELEEISMKQWNLMICPLILSIS